MRLFTLLAHGLLIFSMALPAWAVDSLADAIETDFDTINEQDIANAMIDEIDKQDEKKDGATQDLLSEKNIDLAIKKLLEKSNQYISKMPTHKANRLVKKATENYMNLRLSENNPIGIMLQDPELNPKDKLREIARINIMRGGTKQAMKAFKEKYKTKNEIIAKIKILLLQKIVVKKTEKSQTKNIASENNIGRNNQGRTPAYDGDDAINDMAPIILNSFPYILLAIGFGVLLALGLAWGWYLLAGILSAIILTVHFWVIELFAPEISLFHDYF